MPLHNWFSAGNWNFQCDQCGRIFKSDQALLRWDGARVDIGCYETRHPQDFVRAVHEDISVPVARPFLVGTASAATLGANISASVTSLTLTAGEGSRFPALGSNPYVISVEDASTPGYAEFMKVGGLAGDTFSGLTRGVMASQARAFAAGALVSLVNS